MAGITSQQPACRGDGRNNEEIRKVKQPSPQVIRAVGRDNIVGIAALDQLHEQAGPRGSTPEIPDATGASRDTSVS
jgi:hypothetical protein